MIPNFSPRQEYVGTGNQADYTFNFLITDLSQILVMVTDANFNLIFAVRGTDTQYLSEVVFDGKTPTGIVSLVSDLTTGYLMTILQANDAPVQGSTYRDQGDFTLRRFEMSLDYAMSAIQRLQYLAQRSFKIGDSLQIADPFNVAIPINSTDVNVQNNIGKSVIVAQDNKSLTLSPFVQGWQMKTLNYSDVGIFLNSRNAVVDFLDLPAGAILRGIAVRTMVAFAGPGISDVTCQIGIGSSFGQFINSYDLASAPADQNFQNSGEAYIGSWANTTAIYASLAASGANLNQLTSGQLNIYYIYDIV